MNFEVVQNEGSILEKVTPTVIKVIGCGGGGSNAVRNMIEANIQNIDFIAMNTDAQALSRSIAKVRIPIGQKLTQGLGAGGDPTIGEKAAEEDKDAICNALRGANMVFVTAGMGGGTGTGSAPVVARIAKEMGILTVGIVTTPFDWEGPNRAKLAAAGLVKLQEEADTVIVIPNTKIVKVFQKANTSNFIEQLRLADDLLRQAISGMANIVTSTGQINIDFADVRRAMENQKTAIFGIGVASGKDRASTAAYSAFHNPLLEDININGAKHILVNIIAASLQGAEVEEVSKVACSAAAEDYELKTGVVIDESLGDEMSVTVIATGFGEANNVSKEAAAAPEEAEAAVVEQKQNEPVKNDSVFSMNEFSDALSGKRVPQGGSQNPSLFSQSDSEKVARPGDYGSFGSVNANRGARRPVDANDLEVPTSVRNDYDYPRTFNFNKGQQK